MAIEKPTTKARRDHEREKWIFRAALISRFRGEKLIQAMQRGAV
jgi:hypothetical protein